MRLISKGKLFIAKNQFTSCLLGLLIPVVYYSCKESEIYPDIPSIEFKSYSFTVDPLSGDTLLQLTLGYKDGDGDIGLNPGDTFPPYNPVGDSGVNINPYHNNIFADFYEWKENNWVRVINPASLDTVVTESRIENITPEGKHKAIRGTIEWQVPIPYYDELSDSLLLSIWIYDRALHQSNIVQTPVIVLP